jgi:hypothetical protein
VYDKLGRIGSPGRDPFTPEEMVASWIIFLTPNSLAPPLWLSLPPLAAIF